MGEIGFVLVTYQKPEQMLRLIRRLLASFPGAPIACHHDFGQLPLDLEQFPSEVRFVRPHLATAWGDFSVVRAFLSGLRLLYEGPDSPDWDWVVLLSGADYPIKSGARIVEDLAGGRYDVYMHHERIEPGAFARDWQRSCYRRYFGSTYTIPFINRSLRPTTRSITIRSPRLRFFDRPFSDRFHCFAGEAWLSASRKAVVHLLRQHSDGSPLARRYERSFIPEESYFHTLLGNAPDLRIANDSKRYTDWSEGRRHPKTLTVADLPRLLASGAHF